MRAFFGMRSGVLLVPLHHFRCCFILSEIDFHIIEFNGNTGSTGYMLKKVTQCTETESVKDTDAHIKLLSRMGFSSL